MRSIIKNNNKKGQFTDLFVFMIITLIILLVSGLFIFMGIKTSEQLDESFSDMNVGGEVNYSQVKAETFDQVNVAYSSLYWIAILLIVGMIISIFVGSYMVISRPIFFVPYIFIVIIAIIVSVGISNAYQDIVENPQLAETFSHFIGANFIMYNLPLWIAVIGFVGGIVMFVRMKSQEGLGGGYGYQ